MDWRAAKRTAAIKSAIATRLDFSAIVSHPQGNSDIGDYSVILQSGAGSKKLICP